MRTRLAAALGVLLFACALAATFLPASAAGAHCGTWVSPAWSDREVADIEHRAGVAADNAEQLGETDIATQARAIAVGTAHSQAVCSDAMSTRRNVALVLLGLTVLVPMAVWFVGGGLRQRATVPS